jgi:hypothetical protein
MSAAPRTASSAVERVVAGAQGVLGVLLLGGIWFGLPARWLWVDAPGSALGLAALIIGTGLLARAAWARALTRYVLWSELVIGSLTFSLLAASAAQLAGSYGPVGAGGALLMLTIAALVLPYLIAWPALQLWWLREPR